MLGGTGVHSARSMLAQAARTPLRSPPRFLSTSSSIRQQQQPQHGAGAARESAQTTSDAFYAEQGISAGQTDANGSATSAGITSSSSASAQTSGKALYANSGPSASTSGGNGEAFPYGEPLASERGDGFATGTGTSAPVETDAAAAIVKRPVLQEEPREEVQAPMARVRRPVGAFRGGLIGFLLGVSLVGGYGYFRLLDDYKQASSALLLSVDELKRSTTQMSTHLSRISSLESAISKLESSSATKKQVDSLRGEYIKLLESEHLEVLNLRAHVWGIEQDLRNLTKRDTSVRI
ncbi:hypothetical protein JCM10296v2_007467 [Rhodotorula toruloides]